MPSWFAAEVLPLLRRRLGRPDLALKVVGLVQAPSIQALNGDVLELVGQAADLGGPLGLARVMVVPTRFAAGIAMKVHDAAMLGLPMVATTLIRDQLGWDSQTGLLAAANPSEFAEACARLHEDPELWQRLREGAMARVRAECSPERFFDHTPAYAIERLYFHVCDRAGYRRLKIADPALLFDTRAAVRVGSQEELIRFMDLHAASLTSGSLPKRSEAPPMMVRTPPGLRQRLARRDDRAQLRHPRAPK